MLHPKTIRLPYSLNRSTWYYMYVYRASVGSRLKRALLFFYGLHSVMSCCSTMNEGYLNISMRGIIFFILRLRGMRICTHYKRNGKFWGKNICKAIPCSSLSTTGTPSTAVTPATALTSVTEVTPATPIMPATSATTAEHGCQQHKVRQ